jgi:hypothetical protein
MCIYFPQRALRQAQILRFQVDGSYLEGQALLSDPVAM